MASKGPKPGTAKPAARPESTKVVKAAKEAGSAAIDAVAKTSAATTAIVEKTVKAAAAPVVKPTEPAPAPIAAAQPVEPAKPAEKVVEAVSKVVDKVVETIAPAAAAVKPALNPAVTGPAAQKEINIMTNTFETVTEKSQSLFAELNERTKATLEKNAKLVEEMNDLAKGNVEAVVESGKIAAKGIETLSQDAVELSRKHFEQATATMKSLASAKSPTEFAKIQSDYFRSLFDTMVAETSKHTEAMLKLAGDAAQPISNRVAVAADKMKVAA